VRLRSTVHAEDGFALATVMGAIALITAIAMGGFFVAENTLGEATRVGSENRAYQAASSGLEREMSVFRPEFAALGESSNGYVYGTTETINTSDWFQVLVRTSAQDASLGPDEYEMVSVGGSKSASETVSVRFQSFNLWDMHIAGSEDSNMGSGAGFNGNGTIIGKIYCNGDFDWSGNGSFEAGPLFVRHGVFNKQSSGSNVGLPADRMNAYLDNPPTGQTSNLYADLKGTAPKLVIPWPESSDMDNWRAMAVADSSANRLGDGTGTDGVVRNAASVSDAQYNVFNGDLTLTSAQPFGKTGYVVKNAGVVDEAASGDVVAVNGSTLYINGVTYIDGSLTVDNSIRQYVGKGLIVARDGVVINGRLVPAGFDGTDYDTIAPHADHLPRTSSADCLGVASLGDVTQNSADWVCGAFFINGAYNATPTGAKFRGSIIAQGIDFDQPNVWLVTQTGLSANLPEGLPPLNNLNAMSDWVRR